MHFRVFFLLSGGQQWPFEKGAKLGHNGTSLKLADVYIHRICECRSSRACINWHYVLEWYKRLLDAWFSNHTFHRVNTLMPHFSVCPYSTAATHTCTNEFHMELVFKSHFTPCPYPDVTLFCASILYRRYAHVYKRIHRVNTLMSHFSVHPYSTAATHTCTNEFHMELDCPSGQDCSLCK